MQRLDRLQRQTGRQRCPEARKAELKQMKVAFGSQQQSIATRPGAGHLSAEASAQQGLKDVARAGVKGAKVLEVRPDVSSHRLRLPKATEAQLSAAMKAIAKATGASTADNSLQPAPLKRQNQSLTGAAWPGMTPATAASHSHRAAPSPCPTPRHPTLVSVAGVDAVSSVTTDRLGNGATPYCPVHGWLPQPRPASISRPAPHAEVVQLHSLGGQCRLASGQRTGFTVWGPHWHAAGQPDRHGVRAGCVLRHQARHPGHQRAAKLLPARLA